jgi:predicted heme/steroid binding protein/uncharacterized membrane protein
VEKQISVEELQKHDGKDGRAAFVAYRGKIYDVSQSKLWPEGMHQNLHQAGRNLTNDFANALHDESVLKRVPEVGKLLHSEPEAKNRLLNLYFDLHPHPIAVHFPIALTLVSAGFLILYFITGIEGLVDSAFYTLLTGTVMSPIAIMTGASSWWYEYQRKLTWIFKGKAALSIFLFCLELVAVILWAMNREAVINHEPIGWLYLALLMVMVILVLSLGKLGGELVFPSRKK